MRTIEEQIFDRRCNAATVGNEADVRFYDELLGEYARLDEEIHSFENAPCSECERNENIVDDLESTIKSLEKEIAVLEAANEDLYRQLDRE